MADETPVPHRPRNRTSEAAGVRERPRQIARSGVKPASRTGYHCHCERWWVEDIPRRVWGCLWAATLPLRIVAWLLEAAVAAAMVGAMAMAWAWWVGLITDDQVAAFLGHLGARALSVLDKSGVL